MVPVFGVMMQLCVIDFEPSELVIAVYVPEGFDTITVLNDFRVTCTSRLYEVVTAPY